MQMFQRALLAGLKYVLIALMAITIATVCWGVFTRYVLNNSATWTGELGGYLLAWITFLGSAWATFKNTHIRFDSLIETLPRPASVTIQVMFNLIILGFLALVTYYGAVLTMNSTTDEMETLPFSKAVVYVVLPVAGLIMIIGYISETVRLFRRKSA